MIGEHRRLYPDTARTLAYGLLGGLTLGIAARAWMRLIAEKPAFSWKGSIFIVLGFTVFGVTQSIVAVARARATRRWRLTIVRVIGFVGMLPLFMAAGALMFPTVVGGGLGLARADWRRATRVMCVAAGTGSVVFVARDVVHTFGWSFRAAAGLVGLLCIYSAITLATRFTFAPQTDGWRLPRWARPVIVVASGLLLVVAVVGGGGLK